MLFTLQVPFNKVTYRIIGDNKAPSFFKINSDNGDLNLNTSLTADSDTSYTVSISYFNILLRFLRASL